MIIGVGIDVVDIERFGESLTRTPGLSARLFTPAEATRPLASLAARFAAKEALAKALGAPVGLNWHDAELVGTGQHGAAHLQHRAARRLGDELGVASVHVSLSHDAGIASAVVVLEG